MYTDSIDENAKETKFDIYNCTWRGSLSLEKKKKKREFILIEHRPDIE